MTEMRRLRRLRGRRGQNVWEKGLKPQPGPLSPMWELCCHRDVRGPWLGSFLAGSQGSCLQALKAFCPHRPHKGGAESNRGEVRRN